MKIFKNKFFVIFTFSFFLFLGCKKAEVIPSTLTTLKFTFLVNQVQNVEDVRLYLFKSVGDLEQSLAQQQPINCFDSAASVGNQLDLLIDPSQTYFLWVKYYNKQSKLSFTNIGFNESYIIEPLPNNLDVSVNVTLGAVDGNIIFWSDDQNQFPIKVSYGGRDFVLNSSVLTITDQNLSENDAVIINERNSSETYYAKNDYGCVWTGRTQFAKGKNNYIRLEPCNVGQIAFYIPQALQTQFPINIIINEDDNIGNLNGTRNFYNCGDDFTNVVYQYRNAGKYTYFANSANNGCVWAGEFEISKDSCTIIRLQTCNE